MDAEDAAAGHSICSWNEIALIFYLSYFCSVVRIFSVRIYDIAGLWSNNIDGFKLLYRFRKASKTDSAVSFYRIIRLVFGSNVHRPGFEWGPLGRRNSQTLSGLPFGSDR